MNKLLETSIARHNEAIKLAKAEQERRKMNKAPSSIEVDIKKRVKIGDWECFQTVGKVRVKC